MSYLELLKRLYESVKNNPGIPKDEKAEAKELINELTKILMVY